MASHLLLLIFCFKMPLKELESSQTGYEIISNIVSIFHRNIKFILLKGEVQHHLKLNFEMSSDACKIYELLMSLV